LVVVGPLAIAVGAAILLFHLVEEPARRWMRRMVDVGEPNTNAHIDPPDPVNNNLQPIDGGLEARTKAISVRAV
jgi:peptidoglycan/LPS O-acetylase OafA/YrhL